MELVLFIKDKYEHFNRLKRWFIVVASSVPKYLI
jgi:hypothetical protein